MSTLFAKNGFSRPSLEQFCGVFRYVLFPQESTVLRSKHHVSEGNTRRLLEKENRFFCVRCTSKKLSLSCGKAKTMRPHSKRFLRTRRLIASPRKAECISGAVSYVAEFRDFVSKTKIFEKRAFIFVNIVKGVYPCFQLNRNIIRQLLNRLSFLFLL